MPYMLPDYNSISFIKISPLNYQNYNLTLELITGDIEIQSTWTFHYHSYLQCKRLTFFKFLVTLSLVCLHIIYSIAINKK